MCFFMYTILYVVQMWTVTFNIKASLHINVNCFIQIQYYNKYSIWSTDIGTNVIRMLISCMQSPVLALPRSYFVSIIFKRSIQSGCYRYLYYPMNSPLLSIIFVNMFLKNIYLYKVCSSIQ